MKFMKYAHITKKGKVKFKKKPPKRIKSALTLYDQTQALNMLGKYTGIDQMNDDKENITAAEPLKAEKRKWAMTHQVVDVVFFAYDNTRAGETSPIFLHVEELQEWCENN